jgi:xanthine dehydrogenase accessory factor
MAELYDALKAAVAAERPVALVTLVAGPGGIGEKLLIYDDGTTLGALPTALPREQIVADAQELLRQEKTLTRSYAAEGGEARLFFESYTPPPTLFVFGAVHIAVALVGLIKQLGFRTVVVDARAAFATPERFPHADELIHAWPDEALEGRALNMSSYVCVLTHDPKLDDPALHIVLRRPVRYIGALGSPKTHGKRIERLRAEGFSEAELARIHGPIGLELGARTPEEIAVSILAQIVQVKNAS